MNPASARGPWWEKTPRQRIAGPPERTILGHRFLVPDAWIDYPLTDEERKRSPWPGQVAEALEDLYSAILRDGDPARTYAIGLSLPCRDAESAQRVIELTGPALRQPNTVPAVFGILRNVLVNPKTAGAAWRIIIGLEHLSSIDSPMAEVLGLESLKLGDNTSIRATWFFARPPHTLILAASRFVLSPNYRIRHSVQDQANDAGTLRLAALRDPFGPSPHFNLAADEASYQRIVDSFAEWFTQQESELVRKADMDRALIERAFEQMAGATACRP